MGRFGGRELGLGSDLDVMFVTSRSSGADENSAAQYALEVANELRRLLSLPAADPPVGIDADLRPEGRSGPLVRSLASYAAYYERWSLVWEARRCSAPTRGRRRAVGTAVHSDGRTLPLENRWPDSGRGARGPTHSRHAWSPSACRVARILPCTSSWGEVDFPTSSGPLNYFSCVTLLRPRLCRRRAPWRRCQQPAPPDCWERRRDPLREAWLIVSRVRDAIMLVRGRPDDQLPARSARAGERCASCGLRCRFLR